MPQVFETFMQEINGVDKDYTLSYDFTTLGNVMSAPSPASNSLDSHSTVSTASPISISLSPNHTPSNNCITLGNATATAMDPPMIIILDHPMEKFRFRYKSEMMGTHGSLGASNYGTSSGSSRKRSSPSVKLINYSGNAIVRCTLVTSDPHRRMPHAHHLVKKEENGDRDDPHEILVSPENGYVATFHGMGIIHTAKKHLKDELVRKMRAQALERHKRRNVNISALGVREETEIKMDAEAAQKWMNLNSVTLCFQGFVVDPNGVPLPITEPVYSTPINNLKSALTGELKICRIDKFSSSCDGGEEVFILVEKVGKKNIKIKFFEVNEDEVEVWCDYGRFSELDVHHQFAIVFRTPPYRDRDITSPREVFIRLERMSDGGYSEPIKFTYKPRDKIMNRKRPRMSYSGSADFVTPASYPAQRNPSILDLNCSEELNRELVKLANDPANSDEFRRFFEGIDLSSIVPLMSKDCPEDMDTLTTDGPSPMTDDDANFARSILHEVLRHMKREGKSGLKEKVQVLLKERTVYGDTPLHSALRHNQRADVKSILLLLGSDPAYKSILNIQNSSGKTPLHYAVMQNQPDATKALLILGADRDTCDDRGLTPLHTAVKIPDAGACVDALLAAETNLEARDDQGWTALLLAAEAGSLHAVRSLVKAGADVNNTDMSYGRTVLHIAVEGAHKDIVEFLLKETKIQVNKGNFSGNTALHTAVVNTGVRAKELCKLLLRYGADPSIANHDRDSTKNEKEGEDHGAVTVKCETVSEEEEEEDEEEEDDDEDKGIGQTSFDLALNKPEILELLGVRRANSSPLVEVKQEKMQEDEAESGSGWLRFETLYSLASILDESRGWAKLAERLDYKFLLNTLESSPTSPSLTLLNYVDVQGDVSVEKLRKILDELGERNAVRLLDEVPRGK